MTFDLMVRGKMVVKVFFLIAMIEWSCKAPPHSVYQYKEPEAQVSSPSEIVFLSFKIQEDSLGSSIIQLFDKRIVAGTVKEVVTDSQAKDRLVIKQLDNLKTEVGALSVDHPLLKVIEFVNASNAFETKLVKLEEAEFFVRMKLHPKSVYIHIEEIKDEKEIKSTLFTIK